jgi:OOP family OmpA-OmpF porin
MKIFLPFILLFSLHTLQAQSLENSPEEVTYNRWSVEFFAGYNNAIFPLTDGYYTKDRSKSFDFNPIGHFDLGVRYMFSPTFGIKFDTALDQFTGTSGSLPFDTRQLRFGLQGVFNVGRAFRFESFTSRFGLTAQGGLHVNIHQILSGVNEDTYEKDYGVLFGVTPQYRLSDRFVLAPSLSYLVNLRQHYNWDGAGLNNNSDLRGSFLTLSFGIVYYLGSKQTHADWATQTHTDWTAQTDVATELENLEKRVAVLENRQEDFDNDGVPDYIDLEPNSKPNAFVNTRGQTINLSDLIPFTESVDVGLAKTKTEIIADFDKQNRATLFFALNEVTPYDNKIEDIADFMRKFPEVTVELTGFTDAVGHPLMNQKLSLRRAQQVKQYLVRKHIDKDRIIVIGGGVYTSSKTDSVLGDPMARRVDVRFIE